MVANQVQEMNRIRQRLQERREWHKIALDLEISRLTHTAAELGVSKVILFGSAASGETGLTSDLDLIIVWDTPLGFLERTVELYRRLSPKVPVDMLVYTPDEMLSMVQKPFIRHALREGVILYEE